MKRAEVEGALPVNIYTQEDIARSGQPTLADFLNTLNEVSVVSSLSANFQATTGQPTVQLRGLPAGMTLVLLNGRRLEGTGTTPDGALVNLDLIPLAAIERIEILPVGASAVYGGDALAGVVNIILKKSIEGAVATAHYGRASGIDDSGASLTFGTSGGGGNVLAVLSYSQRGTLRGDERAITRNADYRRFGGPDRRVESCNPGTVMSLTSDNLPGLSSPIAGIPSNPSGQLLTPGQFAAGVPNLCSRNFYNILIVGTRTTSAYLTGDYTFSPHATVFGELLYTNYSQDARRGGTILPPVPVPASNAFNPFGVPVRVVTSTSPDSAPSIGTLDTEFTRPLLGLRGSLAGTWEYELSASNGRDHGVNRETNQIINPGALFRALASSDPASAFNPFSTGAAGALSVLSSIFSDREYRAKGTRDGAVGFVRGSLLTLPGGSFDALLGAEYNHDHYEFHSPSTAQDGDLGRTARSVFTELRAPILRGTDGEPRAFEMLTLTAAARRDDYSDFGAANTTQYGIEWRPLRTLLIRASRSEAFKPPLLDQLTAQVFTFPSTAFGLTDPRRGGEPILDANVVFSATPDLKPETGVAKAVGVLWEPESLRGFRAVLTWWKIDQKNRVILPDSPQTILDNEALLPGLVARGPGTGNTPGPVTEVDWRYFNFGKYLVEGIDYEAAYTFATPFGRWSLLASASRTTRYDTALVPGSPTVDRLDHPDADGWAPKWKGRLSVAWQRGPFGAGVTGRYVSRYFDYGDTTRTLGNDWYVDFVGTVQLGRALGASSKYLKDTTATLAMVNAFNRLPQYANTPAGYDTYQADIRGRYVAVQISAPFE